MNENLYDTNSSTSNNKKISDVFVEKMLKSYLGHEDNLNEIVSDRAEYDGVEDPDEDTQKLQELLQIYDQYCDMRDVNKSIADGLYVTCLWHIHRYIDPPDVQFTMEDERGNLKLLYDNLVHQMIKKYCVITVNDICYIFTGDTSGYREDNGMIASCLVKQLEKKAYSRTRQVLQVVGEIVGRIKKLTRVEIDPFNTKSKQHLIPVKNGVVYWGDQPSMLLPRSPAWGFLFTLPITYDADASPDEINNFFCSIAETPGDVETLLQIPAQALLQNEDYQQSYLLCGTGANGKSTYISTLNEFIGAENRVAIGLQDFSDNRFTAALLYGKLVNSYADLDNRAIKNSGTFKMLTGGDSITTDRKHLTPITFVNKAVFVFSANEIPEVDDTSYAFFRRWRILTFPHKFPRDETFKRRLLADKNLSALLNLVIVKMRDIERNGIPQSDDADMLMEFWKQKSDSVYRYVVNNLISDPDHPGTIGSVLWEHYLNYCEDVNAKPKSRRQFFEELPRHIKTRVVRPRQTGGAGNESRPRYLQGIRIATLTDPNVVVTKQQQQQPLTS